MSTTLVNAVSPKATMTRNNKVPLTASADAEPLAPTPTERPSWAEGLWVVESLKVPPVTAAQVAANPPLYLAASMGAIIRELREERLGVCDLDVAVRGVLVLALKEIKKRLRDEPIGLHHDRMHEQVNDMMVHLARTSINNIELY